MVGVLTRNTLRRQPKVRARFSQRDRIALAFDIAGIGVDLVQEEEPCRHRAQPDRAVRARHHQLAARELLRELAIAAVARAGRRDSLPDRRRLLDQRVDALVGEALGQFRGRLHREHRTRRVVDDVADPVVAALGAADLGTRHEHDAPRRMSRRQRVHDLAQVGRARGAPRPWLGGAAAPKHAVPVGPFRDEQRRLRRHAVAPGL